jgi:N-acetylmuramoyl-L-alanine amidase
MKKTPVFIILLLLLCLPALAGAETYHLKLRASHHLNFLRIVIEGQKSIIIEALVYQKGRNVLVNFPDRDFLIQSEEMSVIFSRVGRETVMFYPGEFRGLKVFRLEHPDRLVIDVYMKEKREISPLEQSAPEKDKKPTARKVKTVIIDPGHGGYASGIVEDSYIEKHIVLDIAKKLSALLERGDSKSHLTRGSDRFLTQKDRLGFANSREMDIFVSIHVGNHADTVIYVPVMTERYSDIVRPHLDNRGQEEYLRETVMFLNAMKEAFITSFGEGSVSVRPLPYSMLSKIESAALIVELPSFEDADYIEELRTEMASTLYRGIYIYDEIKAK